eukprot:m.845 g.845  ORF g.845 m.845 type:complete len:165 (+) comp5006_c0_seq1:34-528(+)
MNLKSLFNDFNSSKFVVFFSLLLFSIILSLRIDNKVACHYCAAFLPLWIWKALVFAGSFTGIVIWCKHPEQRTRLDSSKDFRAMIKSAALQMLLFIFEVLVCVKADSTGPAGQMSWLAVFIPLLLLSTACIGACVWACRNDRSMEVPLYYTLLSSYLPPFKTLV